MSNETETPRPAEEPDKRKGGRRTLRGISTVMIVAGLIVLADALLTVLWQEPVSAVYARLTQSGLNGEFDELRAREPSAADRRALGRLSGDDKRIAFAARSLNRRARDGQPVARINIPRIDLKSVVIAGTGPDVLRRGPGHYPDTSMPGAPGTVGIAGHRTTYGAPFRKLDKLKPGDRITVEMPYATVTYEVRRTRIVLPTATWVVDRRAYDQLVLTACHPLYSAEKRIVVFARQVRERPAGTLS